jgi:beta-alanine degradation protein BauB
MAGDAVTVAPHMYKVVLENDRVRVLEVQAKPGDKTEMHSHPAQVAIAITDSQLKFTTSDGKTMETELKAGRAMYVPPVEHTTEITGSTEAHLLVVELK